MTRNAIAALSLSLGVSSSALAQQQLTDVASLLSGNLMYQGDFANRLRVIISGDGSTVAGTWIDNDANLTLRGFRRLLTQPSDHNFPCRPWKISYDGKVVVGHSIDSLGTLKHVSGEILLTTTDVPYIPGWLPDANFNFLRYPFLSGDGNTVAVTHYRGIECSTPPPVGYTERQAFTWSPAVGWNQLSGPSDDTTVTSISYLGKVMAVSKYFTFDQCSFPLPNPPPPCAGTIVTMDGAAAYEYAIFGNPCAAGFPLMTQDADTYIQLGDARDTVERRRVSRSDRVTLPLGRVVQKILATNANASVLLVELVAGTQSGIWTESSGTVQETSVFLAGRGIGMQNWTGLVTTDISVDGSKIVGKGYHFGFPAAWMANLSPDRDGDAIPDSWEVSGIPYRDVAGVPKLYVIDVNDDGISDANPLRKDIFVEVDRMSGQAYGEDEIFGLVVQAFNIAPITAPLNVTGGLPGIALHLLKDDLLPAAPFVDEDSRGWADLHLHKFIWFGTQRDRNDPDYWARTRDLRRRIFRYCILAESFPPISGAGVLGRGEIGGDDFMIAQPPFVNSTLERAGTFMHELGHTLGLRHGGADDRNYKPNYFSVMNYLWSGPSDFGPQAGDAPFRLDYSREQLPTLNESALDEVAGLGSTEAGVIFPFVSYHPDGPDSCRSPWGIGGQCNAPWHPTIPTTTFCILYGSMQGPIDWNNDGTIEDNSTATSPNTARVCSNIDVFIFAPENYQENTLVGHNDWANLAYDVTTSAWYDELAIPSAAEEPSCPTPAVMSAIRALPAPIPSCSHPAPVAGPASPATASTCGAAFIEFSVSPQGQPPYFFRWYRFNPSLPDPWVALTNGAMPLGSVIDGASRPRLRVSNGNRGDLNDQVNSYTARFKCRITDMCGASSESAECTLDFSGPSITPASPLNIGACPGGSADLAVVGSGQGPFTYQWGRSDGNAFFPLTNGTMTNGLVVSGANADQLSLSSINAEDLTFGSPDAYLMCRLTDTCGVPVTTPIFRLVIGPPSVGYYGVGYEFPCGGSSDPVVFSAEATGAEPLTYQWRRNGESLTNNGSVTGATTATLTIQPVQDADGGRYECVVTNACGTTIGALSSINVGPVRLVTDPPPPVFACVGGSLNTYVDLYGSPGTIVQWYKSGVALVDGLNGDGLYVNGAQGTSIEMFNLQPGDFGALYTVHAVNGCGDVTSLPMSVIEATLAVAPLPNSRAVCSSGSFELAVVATFNSPFVQYYWEYENPEVPGEWLYLFAGEPIMIGGMPCATFSFNADGSRLGVQWPSTPACATPLNVRCAVYDNCSFHTTNATSLVPCPADIDCSGAASVQDIFTFLAFYFANDPRADFNASGVISVQDIFDFLAAYFVNCS